MGLFSDLVGKIIPGPFYTDYPGDYPDDRHESNEPAAADPASETEENKPPSSSCGGTGQS